MYEYVSVKIFGLVFYVYCTVCSNWYASSLPRLMSIIKVCIYNICSICSTVCITCHMLPYRVSKAISVPAEIWSSDELLTKCANSRDICGKFPLKLRKNGVQCVGLISLLVGIIQTYGSFSAYNPKINGKWEWISYMMEYCFFHFKNR